MSDPIQRILIVGGGTAGWMAAAILRRATRHIGVHVVLVESPDIGTIGVGEATIPSIVQFVRAMGFDEAAFMRACSASYKLGIRFTDWVEPRHEYWHPFGLCGGQINGIDLFHFWRRQQRLDPRSRYFDYSLQAELSLAERAPRPFSGPSPVIETGSYAYHLDAAELASFLRSIATGEGVEHIFGKVENVVRDETGAIAKVGIVGGREVAADLYVDCSGFAGVLAEQALGDPWIDWSHLLLCDRAVAMPVPHGGAIPPYTHSTALAAGWMWQIGLSSRMGTGYVYSSAHLAREAAEATLIERAELRRARAADPRHLKMRVGRRTNFWTRNCVAIGLAAGFVEPLESTGIHLLQRGVELLVDLFPDRRFDDAPRLAYNRAMERAFHEVRDFIILHYYLNRRQEPFWRDARAVALPDSLQAMLGLYDEMGVIDIADPRVFRDPSYYFILSGGERLPRRSVLRAELNQTGDIPGVLNRIRTNNRVFADQMPTHRDYLSRLHQRTL